MAAPARTALIGRLLAAGDVKDAVDRVTPSELFSLARELAAERNADDSSCLAAEIRQLAADSPAEVNYAAISRAFGTPKPTLANSYRAGAAQPAHLPDADGLLQPHHGGELGIQHAVLGGAGRRAEPFARRSSTCGFPSGPSKLVEQIFASHLEDWPAVLKSLRSVGDDVRAHSRAAAAADTRPAFRRSPNR